MHHQQTEVTKTNISSRHLGDHIKGIGLYTVQYTTVQNDWWKINQLMHQSYYWGNCRGYGKCIFIACNFSICIPILNVLWESVSQ